MTAPLHMLLLADFGMCVVLWLVQLVIYPSFLHLKDSELVAWHRSYTFRVSFVIIPLMLSQLVLAVWVIWSHTIVFNWVILGLVVVCWALTFCVSVPLHRKIEQGDGSGAVRRALVSTNWSRTVLWTAVFLLRVVAIA